MDWDLIYSIVSQWHETGLLLEADKPVLQAAYAELTGDTGERCRRCESYWSDVQHTLRYHLIKVLGYQAMDNTNKYIISEDAGYIQIHGLPYVYVNKGKAPEGESAKHLTDEIAERLLKENPDRDVVIVKNPNYDPDAGKAKGGSTKAAPAASKPATKPKAPAKPKAAPVAPETTPTVDANPSGSGSTPDGSQSETNTDTNV